MKQLPSRTEFSDDDSSIVNMNYFVRTLSDIHTKGVRPDLIGSVITHYASMWLPDLSLTTQPCEELSKESPLENNRFRPCAERDSPGSSTARWKRERMCVEALVGVLPPERGSVTCDFLLRLLRMGNMVSASSACRAELERRVTWQLEQASLQELLIPSFSHTCGTVFDVELFLRLVKGFVNLDKAFPLRSGAALANVVAKLVDCYLAEAAMDSNLRSSEILALASALPDHARSNNDDLYRAIDTYFKAHPGLSKQERKSLCRTIDPCKLSHEAGLHAIQNDRLPVRAIVRIIFSEQTKLHHHLDRSGSVNYASLGQSKRENTQQIEIKKLREDVVSLETRCATMQAQIERILDKPRYSKWKKIGLAALKSVGGGRERTEVEGEFEAHVVVQSKSAKGKNLNKWRRSVS